MALGRPKKSQACRKDTDARDGPVGAEGVHRGRLAAQRVVEEPGREARVAGGRAAGIGGSVVDYACDVCRLCAGAQPARLESAPDSLPCF